MRSLPAITYESWTPPVSRWSPWAKPVLFAQEGPDAPRQTPGPINPAVKTWIDSFSGKSAFVIDLPGPMSVELGLQLARLGWRPVPLFNTTCGPMAIVDAEEIRVCLFAWANDIASIALPAEAPPAFLLDSHRHAGRQAPTPGDFDNRWVTFPQDFPSGRLFRAAGIENIVLWQERSGQPDTDLSHVMLRWQQSGLNIWIKARDPAEAPQPSTIDRSPWYRTVLERLVLAWGLKRNNSGGFGASIPMPSSGG